MNSPKDQTNYAKTMASELLRRAPGEAFVDDEGVRQPHLRGVDAELTFLYPDEGFRLAVYRSSNLDIFQAHLLLRSDSADRTLSGVFLLAIDNVGNESRLAAVASFSQR